MSHVLQTVSFEEALEHPTFGFGPGGAIPKLQGLGCAECGGTCGGKGLGEVKPTPVNPVSLIGYGLVGAAISKKEDHVSGFIKGAAVGFILHFIGDIARNRVEIQRELNKPRGAQ